MLCMWHAHTAHCPGAYQRNPERQHVGLWYTRQACSMVRARLPCLAGRARPGQGARVTRQQPLRACMWPRVPACSCSCRACCWAGRWSGAQRCWLAAQRHPPPLRARRSHPTPYSRRSMQGCRPAWCWASSSYRQGMHHASCIMPAYKCVALGHPQGVCSSPAFIPYMNHTTCMHEPRYTDAGSFSALPAQRRCVWVCGCAPCVLAADRSPPAPLAACAQRWPASCCHGYWTCCLAAPTKRQAKPHSRAHRP